MLRIKREPVLTNINELLPVEILVAIFYLLEVKNVKNVALVCKLWNQLLKDPAIWRAFYIRNFNLDPEQIPTDLSKDWRKIYHDKGRVSRLRGEVNAHQEVLDKYERTQELLSRSGHRPTTPLILSARCGGITCGSTIAGGLVGAALTPLIQFPACGVITFFSFFSCITGAMGGTHYEKRRSEKIVSSNQPEITAIEEQQPLLRSTLPSLTMRK